MLHASCHTLSSKLSDFSAARGLRLSQIWFVNIHLYLSYLFYFSFWRISTTVWRSKRLPIEQHSKQLPKSRQTSRTQWIRITIVYGTQHYLNSLLTCRAKRESTNVNSRRWVFVHALPMAQNGHLHKQRFPFQIATLGQLELNANNNEEVKREAISIRRTRFLRCLAKQYIL